MEPGVQGHSLHIPYYPYHSVQDKH